MNTHPLEVIQSEGLESMGLFYGIYRGVVLDASDPEGLNSLQVILPGFYDGLTVTALPFGQGGTARAGFKHLLPKEGSIVYVMFERGLPHQALWAYHGWALEEHPKEMDPDTCGLITPKGQKIYLSEEDGKLFVITNEAIEVETKLVNIKADDINLIEGKVGVPESTKLQDRLSKIEQTVNAIHNAIRSAIPSPGDGGSALKAQMVSLLQPDLQITTISDIASEHIKQPN